MIIYFDFYHSKWIILQYFIAILQQTLQYPFVMTHNKENRVVELASFATAAEAEVAASMLRSMGVEVSVVNEISSIMLPYINDNRVRLLIAEQDRERALQLLNAPPMTP